jgi:hypothetical protein
VPLILSLAFQSFMSLPYFADQVEPHVLLTNALLPQKELVRVYFLDNPVTSTLARTSARLLDLSIRSNRRVLVFGYAFRIGSIFIKSAWIHRWEATLEQLLWIVRYVILCLKVTLLFQFPSFRYITMIKGNALRDVAPR